MPIFYPPLRQRLICLLLGAVAVTTAARAEETLSGCPQIQPLKNLRLSLPKPGTGLAPDVDDQKLHISADRLQSKIRELSVFTGNVELRRDNLRIFADEITYNEADNRMHGAGNVSIANENGDTIYAPQLHYSLDDDTGYTGRSQFGLANGSARGDAERISFSNGTEFHMENMHYTTCPPGQDDWVLSGSRLKLDREKQIGTARNISIRFMHVPIFYAPYFSFPLGDERKTGFLVPYFGHSDKRGYILGVPYYINLAPNYDDTLTPRFMSRRGLQLQNEFRYLENSYNGNVDIEYLPNDSLYNDYRAAAKFRHTQGFSSQWTGSTDLQWVSDRDYLVDLGDSIAATSATHIPRTGQLNYNDNIWRFALRASNFQTVDQSIAALDRPYARLPQITLAANAPGGPNRLRYTLDSEWINFDRSAGVVGQRLDINPSLSLPLQNSYGFLIPKAGYRYTAYNLQDTPTDETPERSLPIYSLDSGLLFERNGVWKNHDYIQTLEPRLFYLHVPYKNQDSLPIFDAGVPDFSFYNLFRENRFIGADRLGDADQATLAISSRFLHADTGIEQIRLSLGQTFYFQDPQVVLPASRSVRETSDWVAEIQARLGQDWYVRGGLQWDSKERDTEKGTALIQYRPAKNKIASLAYRYNKSVQEQVDASGQWPLSARWVVMGRWNYALAEERVLQSYAGFEYTSCCWAFRITKGKRILSDGNTDSPLLFELELTGLAKLGPRPQSPLDQGKFIFE